MAILRVLASYSPIREFYTQFYNLCFVVDFFGLGFFVGFGSGLVWFFWFFLHNSCLVPSQQSDIKAEYCTAQFQDFISLTLWFLVILGSFQTREEKKKYACEI